MNAHTFGPWRLVRSGLWYEAVCDDGHTPFWIGRKSTEIEGNARLIAAAPEMLETLRVIDKFMDGLSLGDYPCSDEWQQVKAAIAKATGEPR